MRAALSLRCGCVAQTRRLRFIPPYSPGTLAPVVMRHCGRFGTVSKTVDGRKVVRGSNPSPSATDRNFRRLLVFCASGDRSAGGALASTNVSERPLCGKFIPPPFPRDRWRLHEQPAAAERLHERDRRRSRPGTSLPLVPRLAPPTLAIVAARLQRTAKRRLRLGPRLRIDSRPQGCRFDSYTAHRDRRESPATAGFLMPAPRLSVRRTAGGSTPRSTERARCVLDSLPPAVRAEARTRQPAPSRRRGETGGLESLWATPVRRPCECPNHAKARARRECCNHAAAEVAIAVPAQMAIASTSGWLVLQMRRSRCGVAKPAPPSAAAELGAVAARRLPSW
jgi:hypothetical protein